MITRDRAATLLMMLPGVIVAVIYAVLAITDAPWRIWIAP